MFCCRVKKKVSIIVAFALLITSGILPDTYGKAAEVNPVIYSGDYGENGVKYSYINTSDINSTLILEGSGTTPDIAWTNGKSMDASQTWINEIKENAQENPQLTTDFELKDIVVGNGVVLGEHTFTSYRCIENIYIYNVSALPELLLSNQPSSAKASTLNIYIYGSNAGSVTERRNLLHPSNGGGTIYVASDEMKQWVNEEVGSNGKYVSIVVNPNLAVDLTDLRIAAVKGQYKIASAGSAIPADLLNPLKTAVSNAYTALDNILETAVSEDQAATLTKAVNDALKAIEGDVFSDLQQLISNIETKYTNQEDDYTTSSWNTLQEKLTAAKQLTDESEKIAIENAISALNEAVEALVSVEELKTKISEVKEKKYYTSASWSASNISDALQAAESGLQNATKSEVSVLIQNLTEAIAKLQEKDPSTLLDLSKLEKNLEFYKVIIDKGGETYTKESWEAFEQAYNEMKRYVDMGAYGLPEDWTQDNVDALETAFLTASKNLKSTISKDELLSELGELVAEVEGKGYESDKVEEEYWKKYESCLEGAKNLLNGASTTAEYIQETIDKLRAAAEDVEKHPATPAPPVADNVYLELTGSWKKQGENNKMKGHIPTGVNVEVNGGSGYWMEINRLDLSALKNPMLEVEFVANNDTLQIASSTDWDKDAITSKTESSGHYVVELNKELDMLALTSNGSTLEYTMIRIYDDLSIEEAKTKLTKTIDKADKLKQSDYTAASWEVVAKALEEAKKLPEDATAEEIEAANKKLADAIAALKKVGDTTPGSNLQTGDKVTVGQLKYKVTNATKGKCAVAVQAPKSKKVKKLTIPATIKVEGVTCKVTSIASNAFKKCKKLTKITIGKNVTSIGKNAFNGAKVLKNITVKSTKLTKVGKNALKGIHKKAVIKVPKKMRKKYQKLWKKKGQKKSVKIK